MSRSPRPFLTRPPRPSLVAHRGGAALAPENTLAAFENGWRLGADALELDVWMTTDGAVVVFHDDTVDRCTDGTGPIAALSLAAAKRLDAGFRFTPDGGKTFPFRGRGVTIPTLAEVMERFPEARLNFEVKDHRPEIEPLVAEVVRRHRRADSVCLGSADDDQAIRLRERLPEVCHFFPEGAVRCHVMAAKSGNDASGCLGGFDVMDLPLRADVGGMTFEVVDQGTMAWFKARGIPVHVWTVDEEEDMRLALSLGVDAIMTDRPDRLAKVMGRAPRG